MTTESTHELEPHDVDATTVLNPKTRNNADLFKKIGFVLVCLGILGGIIGYLLLSHADEPEQTESPPTSTYAQETRATSQRVGKTFAYTQTKHGAAAEKGLADQPFPSDKTPTTPPSDTPDTPPPPPPTGNTASDHKDTPPIEKHIFLDRSRSSLTGSQSDNDSSGSLGLVPKLPTTETTGGVFDLYAQQQAQNGMGALIGGSGTESLGAQLSATQTPSGVAARLFNRDYLLAKGAYIDCVLNTSLNSTVAGMTKCTLTRDVYSDNGATLLLERGSEVTGEYRANLAQGQARLFVLWDRIKTPHGVVVNLASPGTDSLGGSGVSGYVETHFWQRFGGAMMLSLIDDLAAYATHQNNSNNHFENSSETAQNMAAEALRNTINIPPTFYKNQGERVGIFIARDIDFSRVYQLKSQ